MREVLELCCVAEQLYTHPVRVRVRITVRVRIAEQHYTHAAEATHQDEDGVWVRMGVS